MEFILHEKQEGSLCAQHCLNALLQGSYFTPVDLASLGQRMDDEERIRMAECGVESEEYKKFIEQPSGNMDDSGFFSVQVISSALEVWGLELVPYSSSDEIAVCARSNPEKMQAFICNFKQHWITIRKLGNQWFNLNSLLTGPELISNTYLGMFLAQLQNDGYSIFIVTGNLPYSEADDLLKETPIVQFEKPRFINVNRGTSTMSSTPSQYSSAKETESGSRDSTVSDEDADIQRALNLSLGLDEFGMPLPSTSFQCNNQPTKQSSPANATSPPAQRSSHSSSSQCPVSRIIPITLEYDKSKEELTKKAIQRRSAANITMQDSSCDSLSGEDGLDVDELQTAIELSMEPFLPESSSVVTSEQARNTASSQ